jgi:hypothetical protein
MTTLHSRRVSPRVQWQLEQQGLHPLLARIYAARGIVMRSELDYDFPSLLPPARLTHAGPGRGAARRRHRPASENSHRRRLRL